MKSGAIILTLWMTSDMRNANYTQGHRNGMSYSGFQCQLYLVLRLWLESKRYLFDALYFMWLEYSKL